MRKQTTFRSPVELVIKSNRLPNVRLKFKWPSVRVNSSLNLREACCELRTHFCGSLFVLDISQFLIYYNLGGEV